MLGALTAFGRGVPVLPDYPAMYRDADLVAVVRFVDLKDTHKTKELPDLTSKLSKILFRELNGQIKVVSLFKGTADDPIVCRLYRFPTLDECAKDIGDPEEARKRMTHLLTDFGLVHVLYWGAHLDQNDYLVYLKKSTDGLYIPVTGESNSVSAIRQLAEPNIPKHTNQ